MATHRVFAKIALVVLLALMASVASAQVTIDTTGSRNSSISPFGPPDTQTYGQIVTAPPDTGLLTSFGFLIQGEVVTFRWEVYAWDAVNNRATGPALYESDPVSTTGNDSFELYTCAIPGGVPVTPGNQYVLFASSSSEIQTPAITSWGYCDDVYSDGTFIYLNNGTDVSLWTTTDWEGGEGGLDGAFTATFDPAPPVPALPGLSIAILSAALAAAAARTLTWRRRSA